MNKRTNEWMNLDLDQQQPFFPYYTTQHICAQKQVLNKNSLLSPVYVCLYWTEEMQLSEFGQHATDF